MYKNVIAVLVWIASNNSTGKERTPELSLTMLLPSFSASSSMLSSSSVASLQINSNDIQGIDGQKLFVPGIGGGDPAELSPSTKS